jgi:hypothetical protein
MSSVSVTLLYVPQSIQDRIRGRGAFLTLAVGGVVAVATVYAFRFWGIGALVAAIVLGFTLEFWRELAQNDTTLRALRDAAGRHSAEMADRLRQLEAVRKEADNFRDTGLQLEREVQRLRREVERPELTVRQLLFALEGQIREVDRVRRHREITQRLGAGEWPAVSIIQEGPEITVIAHVEQGASNLQGEVVALLGPGRVVLGMTTVRAVDGRQAEATFRRSELSPFVRSRRLRSTSDPEPYSLSLSGAVNTGFDGLKDAELSTLRGALREAASTISSFLIPKGAARGSK